MIRSLLTIIILCVLIGAIYFTIYPNHNNPIFKLFFGKKVFEGLDNDGSSGGGGSGGSGSGADFTTMYANAKTILGGTGTNLTNFSDSIDQAVNTNNIIINITNNKATLTKIIDNLDILCSQNMLLTVLNYPVNGSNPMAIMNELATMYTAQSALENLMKYIDNATTGTGTATTGTTATTSGTTTSGTTATNWFSK